MTGDPTRAMDVRSPVQCHAGPRDPRTDPATRRGPPPADGPAPAPTAPERPTGPTPTHPEATPTPVRHSRTGVLWTGLILSALVLLFLLIFILQNLTQTTVYFLGVSSTLPLGVALLFAAVGGAVTVALVGAARILQLRRQAKRGLR